MKYHISPKTGRANICRANTKPCPIESEHFDTADEARASYETAMKDEVVVEPLKRKAAGKFEPGEPVESVTVWSYSSVVPDAKALGSLQAAYPDLDFTSSSQDELVVRGPAGSVERYLREPGGDPSHIEDSVGAMRAIGVEPSPTLLFTEAGEALPDENLFSDWEAAGGWGDEAPAALPQLEDDDYNSIKCDDCGKALSECSCGECEFCGAYDDEPHDDSCPLYKPRPRAYSWDG